MIQPGLDWGDDPRVLGPGFKILGGPDDGTFAEQVRVPAANVFAKPARLDWEQAAALPLAGLTAWRALFTRGGLTSGQTVLMLGAGAGTSTFAVQFARAAGARVLVTSSSAEQDRALAWSSAPRPASTTARRAGRRRSSSARGGGVDLVIDSAGTWQASISCLRAGGRVVVFGGTVGTSAELDVRGYYFKQLDLVGTMMGSPRRLPGAAARLRDADLDAGRGLGAAARAGRRRAAAAWPRASTSASSS